MSKKTKIVSVVGGLALGLTANFGLAQEQSDLEELLSNLVASQQETVVDYSASNAYRAANGNPPFANPGALAESTVDAAIAGYNASSATTVTTAEIPQIVINMNSHINSAATGVFGGGRAIGLKSGLIHYSKPKGSTVYGWHSKEIFNGDRASLFVPKTLNNVSWYPDSAGTSNGGLRLTTGEFFLGKMPIPLKAHLDIPINNIKRIGTKIWFDARVTVDEDGTKHLPLSDTTNYVGVLEPLFKVGITEFYGYFDESNGEWAMKFVIDSDLLPPNVTHPPLQLRIYSYGTALQN